MQSLRLISHEFSSASLGSLILLCDFILPFSLSVSLGKVCLIGPQRVCVYVSPYSAFHSGLLSEKSKDLKRIHYSFQVHSAQFVFKHQAYTHISGILPDSVHMLSYCLLMKTDLFPQAVKWEIARSLWSCD